MTATTYEAWIKQVDARVKAVALIGVEEGEDTDTRAYYDSDMTPAEGAAEVLGVWGWKKNDDGRWEWRGW